MPYIPNSDEMDEFQVTEDISRFMETACSDDPIPAQPQQAPLESRPAPPKSASSKPKSKSSASSR